MGYTHIMSEKLPKSSDTPKASKSALQEAAPMTPEEKDVLLRFLSEKQSVLGDTTQKLHLKKPEPKKTDYYELAGFFWKAENATQWGETTLNIDEKFMSTDGVLKNITGKTTINSILKTPWQPALMTLQVPKNIIEWRGVKKDVPHDIQWDEKQKSYVYSSGSAKWLRPFIKDGMILKNKIASTPIVTQENNVNSENKENTPSGNIGDQISRIEALNDSEKKFCKELFGILTEKHAETPAISTDLINTLLKHTIDQIDGLSSKIMGYKNITDNNFILAIESVLKIIFIDKSIPEKIKIAIENKVKSDNDFSWIKIDTIIHENSSERFLAPEQIIIAEAKNKKFIEWQPGIKSLIWDFLPKALWYSGEMSYKQLPLLIAQLQTKHWITPVDGYITDINKPTGKMLLQVCSQAKVAKTWNDGKIGDNNYLPHGIKFVAPLSSTEKADLVANLPAWKNLDDGINDISYQCASFLTYMNGGISGNAWTMPEFIISEWGQEVANTLRDCDWSKLPVKPTMEQIQTQIRTEVKAHPIDIKQIQVGDVITMMHPKSKFQERAFTEWLTKSTRIVSTHVWQVTELNGQLFVTHNIHGVIFTEPLSAIIAGKSLEGDIATWVFRLNKGSDWSSQFTRQKDRLARKVQKNLGGTLAMIP